LALEFNSKGRQERKESRVIAEIARDPVIEKAKTFWPRMNANQRELENRIRCEDQALGLRGTAGFSALLSPETAIGGLGDWGCARSMQRPCRTM